jgi:quercetin dioxygenase-like cupin family protein
MVFEGKVILKLQESEQVLERGDSVTIVAGTGRQWRNESEALGEILVISLGPYR